MASMAFEVRNNTAKNRFGLETEGKVAFTDYILSEGAIELCHTKVPPELEGKGIRPFPRAGIEIEFTGTDPRGETDSLGRFFLSRPSQSSWSVTPVFRLATWRYRQSGSRRRIAGRFTRCG